MRPSTGFMKSETKSSQLKSPSTVVQLTRYAQRTGLHRFKTVPCEPVEAKSFVNASGAGINQYGDKKIALKTSGTNKIIAMPFRVCDVRKALAAVRNIRAKGNLVQFGLELGESFVKKKRSGEKVMLEQDKGKYVLSADLVKDSTF